MNQIMIVCLLVLSSVNIAFAATDEDYAELGIQMKGGISAQEAVARAQNKTGVYHKAQNDLLSALSGKKKETASTEKADKPAPAKPKAVVHAGVKPTDSITLKNGQTVTGVIDETDAKGVWVDMGGGVRTYLSNKEIAKAEKL